jgi:stearoyl-CoA desaturase (delta-9 desaturase)
MYILLCVGVFLLTYLLNTTTISVLYHRGLAHQAVNLRPRTRRLVARMGIWVTGLDPAGWVCMHRRHHEYSDTPADPHSPVHFGLFGVLLAQLRSYERTLVGLARGNPEYTRHVEDLDIPVNSLNRRGLWYLPYVVHFALALIIAVPTGFWALGACYWIGMMSHPIEGWLVNSLGHAVGGRNFTTPDNSRNNHLAAWLIVGEGFQNNHHRYPGSAKFSYHWWEIDPGFALCLLLERLGALEIRRSTLIPSPANTDPIEVQIAAAG